MRKAFLLLIIVMLAAGVVLAQVEPADSEPISTGELRVVNALVGIGPVDIYVNDRMIGSGLPPESATPYLPLSPGRYVIAVYPVGADRLSIPIADILLDLPADHSKTAVVYQTRFAEAGTDSVADVESAPRPPVGESGTIIVLEDNRSPLELGKTRMTALHLAQGTPGKISVAYPSRASLLHELSLERPYGDIDIDAGVYSLTLVDADTPALNRLAFIGERVFQANTFYLLVIVPDIRPLAGVTVPLVRELAAQPRMFVVGTSVQPPDDGIQFRLIHAAHDTAVVDVYIDGRLIAPRFNYGQYTEYVGLPLFSHLIELRRRDAPPDSEPLATAQLAITAENRSQPHWSLLLLNATSAGVSSMGLLQAQEPVGVDPQDEEAQPTVFNTPGGPMTLVLLPDNIAQTSRGSARVRLLHAIDGALEISLFTDGFPPDPSLPTPTPVEGPTPTPQPPVRLVEPVFYGAEANENEVPAGRYDELTFVAGSSSEILSLANRQLLPGMVHTFVLIGQPSGEPPIQALEVRDYGAGLPQDRLYLGTITVIGGSPFANVRRLPSNAAGILDQLENGLQVEVLGRNFDGTWIKIRYTRPGVSIPQEGWVFGPLVQVSRLGEPVNILALPSVS
jgi:hypothetical protein